MPRQESAHAIIYQVLDGLLAGNAVPPGTGGAMYLAIDDMRAKATPVDELRRAEQISLEIHRLEWALRHGNKLAADSARQQLRSLAADWLNARICGCP